VDFPLSRHGSRCVTVKELTVTERIFTLRHLSIQGFGIGLTVLLLVGCRVRPIITDFEASTPSTFARDLTLEGMTFSGSDWQVTDLSLSTFPPATLSQNTLGGCQSSLTIQFNQPQRSISFNFMISSDFSDEYKVTIVAMLGNDLLSKGEYQGAFPPGDYHFPEGYAQLRTRQAFDKVAIFHNTPTNCLYIDNLATQQQSGN
jgi:hypothetical protein